MTERPEARPAMVMTDGKLKAGIQVLGELRCDRRRHLVAAVAMVPAGRLLVYRLADGWDAGWLDEMASTEYIEVTCHCRRVKRLPIPSLR